MPGKRRVLFVDDERFFAASYIKNLEERFEVSFIDRSEEVLPFLEKNLNIQAVVLDIMMPSPDAASDDVTGGGMDTGLWLLGKMRYLGTWPFPVMILSNRNPQGIRDELAARRLADLCVEVRHKLDTPALALPHLLDHLLVTTQRGATQPHQ